MTYTVKVNLPIRSNEVPELRELCGWDRREKDYPILFERCNFWVGVRDENEKLIGFGYICGMGLEHGYMEDILVHPDYQRKGIGHELVKKLLTESDQRGFEIVTVSFTEEHERFYTTSGFTLCSGGVWKS